VVRVLAQNLINPGRNFMRVPEGKYTQRGMVKKRNEEEFR
jgi:hypothetical protein